MHTIEQHIDIDDTPAAVWAVLTNGPAYPDWNPFIIQLEGELRVGAKLTVRIAPPGGRAMTFRPTVTSVEPAARLEWLGRVGLPGIFDGRHSFTLTELDGGRTRLTQAESFSGILTWLSKKVFERTSRGFSAMNAELAARCHAPSTV
jgi:hypothetical protein